MSSVLEELIVGFYEACRFECCLPKLGGVVRLNSENGRVESSWDTYSDCSTGVLLDSREPIVEKLKDTGKYRLTEHGKVYREKIRLELAEQIRLGTYQSSPDIVEVDSIGRDYFCRGTIAISSHNKLPYDERQRLDKAFTQAIRTIKPAIPPGCRHAKVSIVWHRKQ